MWQWICRFKLVALFRASFRIVLVLLVNCILLRLQSSRRVPRFAAQLFWSTNTLWKN